ncbi:MAG: hypothetical protein N0A00_08340 [Candidatus Bathyarchaeota archaeon]|nr:hypothetical protein [Candidatus Bathyarchaeota archaeon]
MRVVNWFGIAGGVAAILLIAVSLHTPWWQLVIGEDFLRVNVSPFNLNFSFLGMAFVIPLILALNISSLLMLLIGGIILIIYSLSPYKAYSKRLLCFAYKKPLYSVIFFLAGIIAVTMILNLMFNISMPIYGTAMVRLSDATQGATVNVSVTTSFQWPFWFAIVTAVLCVAARLYHKKLSAA